MDNSKRLTQSYIALTIGFIILGFSPILIKLANAPGIITSFYRLSTGTLVLTIPFLYSFIKNKQKLPAKGVLIAALAGVCFASDMALWTTGIMFGNATLPTLTGNMAPLWVGIGAIFLFKERQKTGFWIGLFLAFSGIFIMILKDFIHPTGLFKGMMFGLFAGMFYAGYYLFTQPGRKYLNTISFLYISTLSTSIMLGIYAIIFGLKFTGYSQETWTLFIVMGVVVQAGGWFLINFSQGYLPASMVAPTLLFQPVISGIIEWFMPGGRLTIMYIIGGIIVVTGIYLVHFSRNRTSSGK